LRTLARALLYDVRNVSSVQHTREIIAGTFSEVGIKLMGSRLAGNSGGSRTENTRTDYNDIHMVWFLPRKAFASKQMAKADMVCMVWAESKASDDDCNPNYLNDSLPAQKDKVQRLQIQIHYCTKQIAVLMPTGFAAHLFVMKSMCDSNAFTLQASSDIAWDEPGGRMPSVVKDLLSESAKLWIQMDALFTAVLRFDSPLSLYDQT
jgi:hypothetical protein